MGEPAEEVIEIVKPDFARAVKIYRHDIKPEGEKVGEHSQAMSTAYKEIKNECHVNSRAAKFVFKLSEESEEKRNDILRSLHGLLIEMGLGITDDLVARAEGNTGIGSNIVPFTKPEQIPLETLEPAAE